MWKRLTLAALVAGSLMGPPVQAREPDGPFGIYMGMPLSDLIEKYGATLISGKIGPDANYWLLANAPRPDTALDEYYVLAVEDVGACSVHAVIRGENFDLQREFWVLAEQVRVIYDDPSALRGEISGSYAGEYYAFWDGSANTMGDVSMISIRGAPRPRQLSITISFVNMADCNNAN